MFKRLPHTTEDKRTPEEGFPSVGYEIHVSERGQAREKHLCVENRRGPSQPPEECYQGSCGANAISTPVWVHSLEYLIVCSVSVETRGGCSETDQVVEK